MVKDKKVGEEENNLYIRYSDYKNNKDLNLKKLKHPVLKETCKQYGLKVSGNKTILTERIEDKFKKITNAIIIQSMVKRYQWKIFYNYRGPALHNRNICSNTTDFVTLEPLNEIPIVNFFSYKDKYNFVYGFNIISLYTLWTKATEKNQTALNPYNRNPLPSNLIKSLRKLIRLSRILKYDIEIQIKEDFIDPKKQLELRILALFQSIDQLGNYSNPQWFNSLSYSQLILFF